MTTLYEDEKVIFAEIDGEVVEVPKPTQLEIEANIRRQYRLENMSIQEDQYARWQEQRADSIENQYFIERG